jgi:hypothetical protein
MTVKNRLRSPRFVMVSDKKALSEVIVSKMPELKVYLTQDRAWKEKYHQNMFDAVALGLMAIRNLGQK